MIFRELTEPTIAARVEEWHRGRESDPTLAPQGVPDLSVVPGYSLDDVRYNCVGLQSPAQARQATKTLLGQLVGIGVGVAFVALTLAQGPGLVTFIDHTNHRRVARRQAWRECIYLMSSRPSQACEVEPT